MILGCFNFLRSKTSRSILSDSCLFYRKFLIRLIATLSPVLMLIAENTLDDTPLPIYLSNW